MVLPLTLLGVIAAWIVTVTATPIYRASAESLVSLRGGGTGAAQNDVSGQARVRSYARIASSPEVAAAVIRDLRLPLSARQLAGRVEATVPSGTVLVDISVRDTSARRARDVANAVAARFGQAVVRVETPPDDTAAPVGVSVIRAAQLPGAPVTPGAVLNLTLGLLLGLGCGIVLALLREAFDTSVRTGAQVVEITGSKPLGVIGHDPRARATPLVSELDPKAPRAEAFRALHSNLRFVGVDSPPRVVVVTGCRDDDGKTTTACNLALTMAAAGASVILVEADLHRPTLADRMGLEGAVGLTDVLVGRSDLDDVLQPWGDLPLRVLPGGPLPPNPGELLASAQLADLLGELRGRAEYVLVDSPALRPDADAAALARRCDGTILVVRHGHTARTQVRGALETLTGVGARLLGTVCTMVPDDAMAAYPRCVEVPRRREPTRPGGGVRVISTVADAAPAEARTDAHTDAHTDAPPADTAPDGGKAPAKGADGAGGGRRSAKQPAGANSGGRSKRTGGHATDGRSNGHGPTPARR